MKIIFKMSLVAISIFSQNWVGATPAGSHLKSVDEVMERLDTVSSWDTGRKVKTPLAAILTEPIMRALWATQILTDSDWIGIKSLVAASYRIDPGGADDASNMFVYTCKGGWVDLGHMIYTALSAKVIYQGLKGNNLLNWGLKKFFKEGSHEAKFLSKVQPLLDDTLKDIIKDKNLLFGTPKAKALIRESAELRIQNYYRYTNRKVPEGKTLAKLVDPEIEILIAYLNKGVAQLGEADHIFWGYWTGFFSMQAGFGVEVNQNAIKKAKKPSEWDGNPTSAWTLEDLPSDSYGVIMGLALERKSLQKSVIIQMKSYIKNFLESQSPVHPSTRTGGKECLATAGDTLKADATYYQKLAEKGYVTHRESDSTNPMSPYNYTINPKRTRSHHCLCDRNDKAYAALKEGEESPPDATLERALASPASPKVKNWYEFLDLNPVDF